MLAIVVGVVLYHVLSLLRTPFLSPLYFCNLSRSVLRGGMLTRQGLKTGYAWWYAREAVALLPQHAMPSVVEYLLSLPSAPKGKNLPPSLVERERERE